MPDVSPAELRARLSGNVTLADEHRLRRRLQRAKDATALRRIAADVERAEALLERRRASVPAQIAYPPQLPVSARRDDLLAAMRDHQVVVVAGETGSGKTTQLPKMLLELGRGVTGAIAHTQPRRIAARAVADRIAEELGVPPGTLVGSAIRFQDRTRPETLIRLMTDGLLLAEVARDRLLRRYDTIVVDEAHERSLNIDFLLGYLATLLPRRPDLKLVVTSATIDPARFAAHFGNAPVVEVTGRTYPVEVRYEPPPADADLAESIADAVERLLRERHHDVLVFLSGEREIRDTADTLAGRLGPDVELLPLFARLTAQEQQRVFAGHDRPRVVLATNVAETSLTVPGIRSVVDPGTARISRYSARLKVQRLPIEPVSQASADQRKGRCGRTAEGVCVRLYDEDDLAQRPRFTDPEILRTNLASVILQMAALELGSVEDFPFLDPPDRRQVRDGVLLLKELGALTDREELTDVGRKLARLPVDPRLGRMVLEADRRRCLEEVLVIAAALSIQDPRERPAERRAAADEQHARFADPGSDFRAFLNLWRYVEELQSSVSGSKFRRRLRDEHLSWLRVREWQDLVGQLRRAAREIGLEPNRQPAEPDEVTRALLAGLLSHVGLKDPARRDYQGARNARFALWPGSALAAKQPVWVVVAELVETSRLWGRVAARIRPEWLEGPAEHLVTRSHSEPRWDRKRAEVVATERVSLYGLPIVAGRTVSYASIDPAEARATFIRRALVDRDWDSRHAFHEENGRRLEEVDAIEERLRRRGLRVADEVLAAFFDERIPAKVVSGAHFDRWWKDARTADPELLVLPRALLLDSPEHSDGRPATLRAGDVELELSYRFEPGAPDDGVTARVDLRTLPRLRAEDVEWLVPALRAELVTTLIRGLPKDVRRSLVPVPDVAAEVLQRIDPARERLPDALARELGALRGVRLAPGDFDLAALPPHLRMGFRVVAPDGRVLAEGKDLDAVREEVRPLLRAELAGAAQGLEQTGLRDWTIGALPRAVALPGTGQAVRAYPALVDEGATAGVRVLDSPAAQAAAMRDGTRRLLLLTVPSPARALAGRLDSRAQLTLAAAPHGTLGEVLHDATVAALDALVAESGGPAWDEREWRALRERVAAGLGARAAAVLDEIVGVLAEATAVRARLEAMTAAPLAEARTDVETQLVRLLVPGFATKHGAARLPDVRRYVLAAARRLERLPDAPGSDRDRMTAIRALEDEWRARLDAVPRGRPLPAGLVEARWLLEELRVAQFAQSLGVRGQVSAKKVRKLIESGA